MVLSVGMCYEKVFEALANKWWEGHVIKMEDKKHHVVVNKNREEA